MSETLHPWSLSPPASSSLYTCLSSVPLATLNYFETRFVSSPDSKLPPLSRQSRHLFGLCPPPELSLFARGLFSVSIQLFLPVQTPYARFGFAFPEFLNDFQYCFWHISQLHCSPATPEGTLICVSLITASSCVLPAE